MMVFVQRPISCFFVVASALLLLGVTWSAWRGRSLKQVEAAVEDLTPQASDA
jgi:cbb3-type cytochrome oxidase subunit 3